MRKDNIFDIRFTGGEVTQRPDWFPILKHAKDLGFSVSLNTNGVFSDSTVIDKLVSLDLEQITISIDGLKETHDFIRGKGNFERALQSLKELHKGGANLRINTLITRPLFKEAESLCELASKYCTEINFFNTRLIGRAKKYLFNKILSFNELARFNKFMDGIASKYPNLNILYRETVTTYNSIKEHNQLGLDWGRCPAGLTRFVLISNGDLYGCGYFPYLKREDLKLGNIKEEGFTLLNVWRYSPNLNDFREFNRKRTLECLKKCSAYGIKCPGMCIADELNRRNLSGGINPYCFKKLKINF